MEKKKQTRKWTENEVLAFLNRLFAKERDKTVAWYGVMNSGRSFSFNFLNM